MKKMILTAIFCLIVFLPQARAEEPAVYRETVVGYENNQSLIIGEKVTASFDQAVANIKNQQQQNPGQGLVMLITGSADQSGKDYVNARISTNRADQVYNKLLFLFPEAKISKVATGDQDNTKAVKIEYYFLPAEKAPVAVVQAQPAKLEESGQNELLGDINTNLILIVALMVVAAFLVYFFLTSLAVRAKIIKIEPKVEEIGRFTVHLSDDLYEYSCPLKDGQYQVPFAREGKKTIIHLKDSEEGARKTLKQAIKIDLEVEAFIAKHGFKLTKLETA
ncbi:hypothetical protein COV49_00560 [Candidatus Falkowbacteria bacterium CG11_big_fil_rev_8_21_14_0_20_39_10]|uniref:OmpA-like domain-containing protein n=1 Tax=Candidatus Falkowbacteria bacterium CG11_big_fil_rev_8_21_14_0_20_39_10 TaxID=1974570 RepID=A0A2M6KA33_9BACT|nr:MAG: hypothetical protein COV49_00560 [Candidatus Falkowbacteria bacterium CG11_big_fil_rev_8_21_14_0_20_39_10]